MADLVGLFLYTLLKPKSLNGIEKKIFDGFLNSADKVLAEFVKNAIKEGLVKLDD